MRTKPVARAIGFDWRGRKMALIDTPSGHAKVVPAAMAHCRPNLPVLFDQRNIENPGIDDSEMMTIVQGGNAFVAPSMPVESVIGTAGKPKAELSSGEVIQVDALPEIETDFNLPGGRDVFVSHRLSQGGAGKYRLRVKNGSRLFWSREEAVSSLKPGDALSSDFPVDAANIPRGVLVLVGKAE